jgi:hypothetical protein
MGISLVLVDDHPLVLNGLAAHRSGRFPVLATCGADDGEAVESLDRMFSFWTETPKRDGPTSCDDWIKAGDPPLSC